MQQAGPKKKNVANTNKKTNTNTKTNKRTTNRPTMLYVFGNDMTEGV